MQSHFLSRISAAIRTLCAASLKARYTLGARAVIAAVALCLHAPAEAADAGSSTAPVSERPVRCVPLETLDNTHTPPALYRGVLECIGQAKYSDAAALFMLAGIESRFDAARVTDKSAGSAGPLLITNTFDGIPDDDKTRFGEATESLRGDRDALARVCGEIRRIGFPTYYPEYMILHGMQAFLKDPHQGALDPNFNAKSTWSELLNHYLGCAPSQLNGTASASRDAGLREQIVARQIASFDESLTAGSLAFGPVAKELTISGDFDVRDVHVWSWPEPSHLLRSLTRSGPSGSLEPLSFSANGTFLAVAQVPGGEKSNVVVRIWNGRTGELVHDLTQEEAGATESIAFTPNGKFLARTRSMIRGSLDDRFIVYRTDTWEVVWGLHPTAENARSADEPFSSIGQMAISADGKFAALGTKRYESAEDGRALGLPMILIVDLKARRVIKTIDNALPLENVVQSLCWSPDGRRIAIGGRVGGTFPGPYAVRVFDAASGKARGSVRATDAVVYSLVYSPDGKYLVAGSIDHAARIFDAKSYELLQALPDTDKIAVSRDSHYLAIAPANRFTGRSQVSIWELK